MTTRNFRLDVRNVRPKLNERAMDLARLFRGVTGENDAKNTCATDVQNDPADLAGFDRCRRRLGGGQLYRASCGVLHGGLMEPLSAILGFGKLALGMSEANKSEILSDKDYKKQRKRQIAEVRGLASLAKSAGFHPLELLRAGTGGGQQGPAIPRVGSQAMFAQAFDQIGDALSGRQAEIDRARELENDLLEIEISRLQAGDTLGRASKVGASNFTSVGSASGVGGSLNRPVLTTHGVQDVTEVQNPTPVNEFGEYDTTINGGGPAAQLEPMIEIVMPSGRVLKLPRVGDFGEVGMGFMALGMDKLKSWISGDNRRDPHYEAIINGPPIPWDDAIGGKKPRLWQRWGNRQRLEYIYELNTKGEN